MTGCRVTLKGREDDLIGRLCTISVGSKSAAGYQIVRSGRASLIEREAHSELKSSQRMSEYYIKIGLNQLREIDSNREKMKEFLGSRLPKIKKLESINVIIVRLDLQVGDRLDVKDIEYLWLMLQMSGNDLIVPPFVSIPRESEFDKDTYFRFLDSFLEMSKSYQPERIVCGVPCQIQRRAIGDLMEKYMDLGTQVYVVDFGGSKPFTPDNEIIIGDVLIQASKIEAETGQDSFFYGLDVKPHKQGSEDLVAENQVLAAAGFNAVGPRHTVGPIKPEVIAKLIERFPSPIDRKRVFSSRDYGYHRISEPSVLKDFEGYVSRVKTIAGDVDLLELRKPSNGALVDRLSRGYSFTLLGREAKLLDESVNERSLKPFLESKVLPALLIPNIQRLKRKIGRSST